MEEKRCSKCKEWKLLSEFSKHKGNKDGLRSDCKECNKESINKYKHTEDGLLAQIYSRQRRASRRRGHLPPSYTNDELKAWAKKQPIWTNLFGNWKKSGYKTELIPSCDRDDDYKSYTLDNIKLKTWEENNTKGHNDRKEGRNNKHSKAVLQYNKEGVFIKEYHSIKQAERETGIHNGHISVCCKGLKRHQTAGGFKWAYKN